MVTLSLKSDLSWGIRGTYVNVLYGVPFGQK